MDNFIHAANSMHLFASRLSTAEASLRPVCLLSSRSPASMDGACSQQRTVALHTATGAVGYRL